MKIIDRLIDLLFPRRACCMGCESMIGCDREDLCEDCRKYLAEHWIGVRMPDKKSGLAGTAYAYPYHGPAGGMVRHLKYGGTWLLAERMGKDLARAAALLRVEDAVITAVPMHPKRLRLRGRNQSELLGREVGKRLGFPYEELLMRTRNAPQQARLTDAQRMENLKGGFAARPEQMEAIRGRTVLLIDDVWTTGATAVSCAKALKDAGAARVYFAAYALGNRKKEKR